MPELPDLEVFAENLNRSFSGKKLEKVTVTYPKKLNVSAEELKSTLEGEELGKVYREGKELAFDFGTGKILLLHMMLRGKLCYFEGKNEEKYSIVEFGFQGGKGFVLTDFQKQATTTLNSKFDSVPDALSPKLTIGYFTEQLAKSKSNIKKFITDQTKIKGIGNAYADEILWDARISPLSICNKVPPVVIKRLQISISKVLKDAIKHIKKEHPEIIGGEVRDFLVIHNSKKETSPTGAEIQKTTIGGRGTYYTEEQEVFE